MLHNTFLICLSSYMCFECINQAVINHFTLWGNGIDSSEKGIPVSILIFLNLMQSVAGKSVVAVLRIESCGVH
jgi:hypothetical protein